MYISKQITKIFLLFLIPLTLACSDDDTESTEDPSDPSNTEASSYDINIEGEGNFSQENIGIEQAPEITLNGIWFENPDNDGELITFSITNTTQDFTISGSLVLIDDNPAPVGTPADFDEENLQTSLINIVVDNKNYISESGNLEISNLELIPQEIPDTPGDTAFANFELSFSGAFTVAGESNPENIEITGDLKIYNPSL